MLEGLILAASLGLNSNCGIALTAKVNLDSLDSSESHCEDLRCIMRNLGLFLQWHFCRFIWSQVPSTKVEKLTRLFSSSIFYRLYPTSNSKVSAVSGLEFVDSEGDECNLIFFCFCFSLFFQLRRTVLTFCFFLLAMGPIPLSLGRATPNRATNPTASRVTVVTASQLTLQDMARVAMGLLTDKPKTVSLLVEHLFVTL